MGSNATCPNCGGALPTGALRGGCPRCLGRVILNVPPAVPNDLALTEQAGDQIGPYKLLERIGEGGCGVVYLAEQEEPIRRQVALKVIKEGMDTKRVIARFEAERQALALMEHPNIAKVLDAGSTRSGRPYFVMELVRGTRITDYCDQQHLSTHARLRIFIRICQAIQHAHQKGIIHRDIKPSNILVAHEDGVPVPKVIDFGIAKATEQRLTEETLFTALEQFVGTPAYMSPEQAGLSSEPSGDLDTRSDIYSLGVLLYELLTGHTPFDTKVLLAQGLDALRKTIREQEPVRPSTKLRQTQSTQCSAGRPSPIADRKLTIESDLDWIVMKSLEKDRTRRYDTASALAADLERHLSHEPILARPPSTVYRMRKAVRRHRLSFAAGGTVVLALLLGAVIASWQAVRVTQTAAVLRLNVYAADMRAADIAVRQENLGLARQLLRAHIPNPGERDLRGVEWRYLWQKAQGDEAIVFELEDAPLLADLSPNGRLVATLVEAGHHAQIWDSESRRVIQDFSLREPPLRVRRLAFHPELPLLALHYVDRLTVWNTDTWQPVMEEEPAVPRKSVYIGGDLHGVELCFSGDGQVLGRLNTEGFETWQVQGWKKTLRAGELPIKYQLWNRLVLNRDGTECIYSSKRDLSNLYDARHDNSIRWWSLQTKSLLWETGDIDLTFSLEISPEGRWLAAGTTHGRIVVWSVPDRRLVADYPAHRANVYALAFSPDGKWLASVGADQDIRLWKSGTSESIARLRGHIGVPWSLRFSGDGRWLASASIDNTARVWQLSSFLDPTNCLTIPSDHLLDPGITPGSSFRTYNRTQHAFETHSVPDGRLLQSIPLSPAHLLTNARSVTVCGSYGLVSGDDGGNLCFWDRGTGRLVRSNNISPNPIKPVLLSRSERMICAAERGSNEVAMLIYDLRANQLLARLTNASPMFHYTTAAFSADENFFAHGEIGANFLVWDLRARSPVRRVKSASGAKKAFSAAFSPDGKLLATGPDRNLVEVWEIATGQRLYPPLTGHLVGVLKLEFSDDGRTLFSFGGDRSFRMWHVATGREMVSPLPLNEHLLSLTMPTMTPDGNWLLEAVDEDRLRWVRLPTLAEIDAVEHPQTKR
ncbi:MAG: protein kinase [Verrucomicrobiia bacterium]